MLSFRLDCASHIFLANGLSLVFMQGTAHGHLESLVDFIIRHLFARFDEDLDLLLLEMLLGGCLALRVGDLVHVFHDVGDSRFR